MINEKKIIELFEGKGHLVRIEHVDIYGELDLMQGEANPYGSWDPQPAYGETLVAKDINEDGEWTAIFIRDDDES